MDAESNKFLDSIRLKHENTINSVTNENSDGIRVKLRALLVGLLGVSMSACAFASQPVELELDDDDVTQKLNNVSFARRLTKPTIRLVMGYSKLSAFVTCSTSLLLLLAVMSKNAHNFEKLEVRARIRARPAESEL
ncbi:jg20636 [Pararge aegeria aegeria]|uniref:Jg20636 protein n=1 Tax=Pararge aegeria aegeria TaxID=348720 RepID=A0A8S4RG84_9NEOP|nr:jg20636 [Pararge aegeria aegeria]